MQKYGKINELLFSEFYPSDYAKWKHKLKLELKSEFSFTALFAKAAWRGATADGVARGGWQSYNFEVQVDNYSIMAQEFDIQPGL